MVLRVAALGWKFDFFPQQQEARRRYPYLPVYDL
jgi:hypothetical protein